MNSHVKDFPSLSMGSFKVKTLITLTSTAVSNPETNKRKKDSLIRNDKISKSKDFKNL